MSGQDIFELLVDQTWQVAVLATLVLGAVKLFAADRPHLAHALWALVLVKCITPPILSSPASPFSWIEARSPQAEILESDSTVTVELGSSLVRPSLPAPSVSVGAVPEKVRSLNDSTFEPLTWSRSKNRSELMGTPPSQRISLAVKDAEPALVRATKQPATNSWQNFVVWFWLAGAAVGLAVMAIRFAVFMAWLNRSPSVEAGEVEATVEKLRQRLGIRFPVKVKVSSQPVGPAVIGLLQPKILLPAALVENKTTAEMEPLFAHELIHVRRGDLWWAMLQTLATRLFWFHPLVWIASEMVTRESERSCDEETIAGLGCRPADYARGLLDVLERKHQLRVAPALPGVRPMEVTTARLERVMKMGNGIQKRTPLWVWLVMLICGAIVLPGAAWAVTQEESAAEAQIEPRVSSKLPATSAATESTQNGQHQEHRFEVGDLLQKVRDNKVVKQSAESILIGELTPFDPIKDTMKLLDGDSRYKPMRGGRISGTQLIVNETPERVEQIQKAIDNARELGFDQIIAETRFLETNQDQIKTLGIEWEQVKSEASANAIPSVVFDHSGKQSKFESPSLKLPTREGIHAVSHIDHSAPVLFSVVSEMELQRIIKLSASREHISMLHAPTVTMFNGQDAEISDVSQRPFVTGVKDAKATNGNSTGKEAIISIFEEGTRMRVKPVLKENTIELDCHVQLREISDVKTVHVSHDPKTNSGTSIQVPTIVATNVEVKRSISLGDTLLLEMLTDEGRAENDTLVLMLTCQKVSPPWAKESVAEKKYAADRAAAIEAAKELTFFPKDKQAENDVCVIKAGAGDNANDFKPRNFEVMGMKFRLEGDVKFEIRNSGIEISGKQLSVNSADEFICSCEEDGTIEYGFDETGKVVSHKMSLAGRAIIRIEDSVEWAADSVQFSFGEHAVTGTLEGNASFHYDGFTGLADRVTFDDTGIVTLSGRASLFRNLDGKPNSSVRGEKIFISDTDEIGGEPKITVDPGTKAAPSEAGTSPVNADATERKSESD
ncbi:hypothetical protein N9L06_01375 [Mariniblastus sp.]|nr:hypothetical protein [Mariniblastus sp.]